MRPTPDILVMPSWAREWVHWDLTAETRLDGTSAGPLPTGPATISLDGGTTWLPTERTGDTVRVRVAGAACAEQAAGDVVLPVGVHRVQLRAVETEETIPARHGAGTIRIT